MTDHPRFDPAKPSPDTAHRAYHGGRLVETVLRTVDWWIGARDRPVLGRTTTDATEKSVSRTEAPLNVHVSEHGLILPTPRLSGEFQDLSRPDTVVANSGLKRAVSVAVLAAFLATGALLAAATGCATRWSQEGASMSGFRLANGQSSMQARGSKCQVPGGGFAGRQPYDRPFGGPPPPWAVEGAGEAGLVDCKVA